MKRGLTMGIVALAMILLSIPTQLLILGLYGSSAGTIAVCVFLALLVGALGANLTSLAFDLWETYKKRQQEKKSKSLHGRRRAGRV